MNSQKDRIRNIANKLDKSLIDALKQKVNLNNIESKTKELKELKENIRILERKNLYLETELKKYEGTSAKNSDLFAKLNNQRNKLNKELVEEEIKNEEMEDELENLKNLEIEGKKTLSQMKYNLYDKIYLELMKGMGFVVEKNDKKSYKLKIVNKDKKEVCNVEENEDDVWRFLE